eukprot:766053-Hanusia_phi.AAC.2
MRSESTRWIPLMLLSLQSLCLILTERVPGRIGPCRQSPGIRLRTCKDGWTICARSAYFARQDMAFMALYDKCYEQQVKSIAAACPAVTLVSRSSNTPMRSACSVMQSRRTVDPNRLLPPLSRHPPLTAFVQNLGTWGHWSHEDGHNS